MYMYHSVSLKQTINSAKDSHKKIFSKRKFKKNQEEFLKTKKRKKKYEKGTCTFY